MSIYKLRGAGTGGTEDSVASLDIQADGFITAMSGWLRADCDADGDSMTAEISFLSTSTVASNDTRGSLFMVALHAIQVSAASTILASDNHSVSGTRIPVSAGERVHLHLVGTAAIVSTANIYIYVEDSLDPQFRRRR